MKTTAFTKYHIAAGAKMAEFAGYNMPIEFTGINDEHMTVRNGAGVFDVSHMGEIWVKGPKAEALLQRITTNDVAKLYDGKVQYSCMPNGRGGIVDDILVYRIDKETYMLCVNAANIDKDWAHICEQGKAFGMEAGSGKELYNASDEICQLAVQGPLAMKIVQKMCSEPVEQMEYYTFRKMPVAGCDAILSITGYTGSGGCEIYVANEDGDKLWKALWEAGAEYGLKNIGLGARDTLRLEKGFCLYGNDIDDTTSPIEAGLGWITGLPRARSSSTVRSWSGRRPRALRANWWASRWSSAVSRATDIPLAAPSGEPIGHVTSGTMSPLHEGGLRPGLCGCGLCQAGYGDCGGDPREARQGRSGEDSVHLIQKNRYDESEIPRARTEEPRDRQQLALYGDDGAHRALREQRCRCRGAEIHFRGADLP